MPRDHSAGRLLVVDDDSATLRICDTLLRKEGYRVAVACSAAEARHIVAVEGTAAFAAVLSDFRMPTEDGLSLLSHLRSIDPSLSTILMTAEGEKDLVAQAMREGVNSYVDKPFAPKAVRDAVLAAVAATHRQRQLRHDASSARAVAATQRLLLGREAAKLGGRLRLSSRAHARAGGDFASVFGLGDDRFVVFVTDVSGHDLRAAYHSVYLQGVARGLLAEGADLVQVFTHLNRLLLDEWNTRGRIELSLAACAVAIDLRAQTSQLINCGLPCPRFSNNEGWSDVTSENGSSPLGWFDELPVMVSRPFAHGRLQFWSDGLDDLAERLGVSPLALNHRLQDEPSVLDLLPISAADDIIAASLDLSPSGSSPAGFPLIAESYSKPARDRIDDIQRYYEHSLRLALPTLAETTMVDALLCLREGLLNALDHGCGDDPAVLATVQVAFAPASQSLLLCISDTGAGHQFDLGNHEVAAACDLLTSHRGLIMMKNLSQNFTITSGGSRVTMEIPVALES
ncbi:MAG: response regulator [Verrucomicrobia bacterium]|nr:response regulator [Verrucomicrobiota bacterium]